jgi:hypothetical protein
MNNTPYPLPVSANLPVLTIFPSTILNHQSIIKNPQSPISNPPIRSFFDTRIETCTRRVYFLRQSPILNQQHSMKNPPSFVPPFVPQKRIPPFQNINPSFEYLPSCLFVPSCPAAVFCGIVVNSSPLLNQTPQSSIKSVV